MRVSIFGNPDLPFDAVAADLVPLLQPLFPAIEFVHQDPNEECQPVDSPWVIIDVVKGIDKVTIIDDTRLIETAQRVSMHDYDLGMHLTLLKKIYPDLQIRIIGIPIGLKAEGVLDAVKQHLSNLLSESGTHSSYKDHKHEPTVQS